MIICDACDRGFHTYCLQPPKSRVPDPENTWVCQDCEREKKRITAEIAARTAALNAAHPELVHNVRKSQKRQKQEYAKRRETATSLPPIGTLVWVRRQRSGDDSRKTGKKHKLPDSPWFGPLTLGGYSADLSRGIVQTASACEQEAVSWSEECAYIVTDIPKLWPQKAKQEDPA